MTDPNREQLRRRFERRFAAAEPLLIAAFYAAWNAAEPDSSRAAKAAAWQGRVDAR